ncbi:MAG: hypothetical protein Q9169_007052 [Polycauliona sp. 2 TL-2023]
MSGIFHDDHHPPSPPPAPPLPPQKYGNRAASAIARFAQPFIYASRPSSAHGDRPSSREYDSRLNRHRRTRTGLPINALDISPDRTHAILAGREILKTIRVTESACTEESNLRSKVFAYAAARDSSDRTIPARHKDHLTAIDVKWSRGNFHTKIATAATGGQIVLYDINSASVEVGRLHEHSRQVHTLAFNPHEGALLLSGSQDSTVRLWDLRVLQREGGVLTCQSKSKFPGNSDGIRALQWSPTIGEEFALGTDNGAVQRWDARKPDAPLLKNNNAHKKACYAIDWHPDGKHLASGGADKSVKIWDFSSTDRRMKPRWYLRTPRAVHNVRWRPSHWETGRGSPGHLESTQLATSYDNGDPRTHIWDLRRPAVPARVINRYDTAPTALLWHSESLLWSVGNAGMFTQTDIDFAKKVSDEQTTNTMATAPDGSFALFLEDRTKETGSRGKVRQDFHQRHERAGSIGDRLSTSLSAAESSFEEPNLLSSSLRSRRRKAPKTPSSRSLAGTPPPAGTEGPTISLDEAMHNEDSLRPLQKAAHGGIRGVFEAEAFNFLACHYACRIPTTRGADKTVLGSLCEALSNNADLAAHVGQFRLAQSWRILTFALQKELSARADRNGVRRSLQSKHSSKNKESVGSIDATPNTLSNRRSTIGSQSASANVQRKLPTNVSIDGGSNMTTPLVRPVPNPTEKSAISREKEELDGQDSLELPEPRFRKRSPQKPAEKHSALSRLRSPNDDDGNAIQFVDSANTRGLQDDETVPQGDFFDIDRHMSERRAAMQNYRTIPRPVLRLEDSVQILENHSLVPRFDRHDSNESFQMFSASSDSSHRAKSVISSFTSSQGSGSSGPTPERWLVNGQQAPGCASATHETQNSSPSSRMVFQAPDEALSTGSALTAPSPTLERPTIITRILHGEDTYIPGRGDGENVRNEDLNVGASTESDIRPSPHDPPPAFWSATAMFGPLIDYHLQQLLDVQLPAHLLLLLEPYIEHDIPDALVSSIFLDYHTRLTSLSLHAQAARLRNLTCTRVPEVAEYGTYEIDTGGPWCTTCQKSSKGDKRGFCSRCQRNWASCPVCDGNDPLTALGKYASGEKLSADCNWGWCQECGHGGHVVCLRVWWNDLASEGGCPTLGCLHDCVAGSRRAAVHQREADAKKTPAVKGDTWVVGESRAVEKARGLVGRTGKDGLTVQDHPNTRSSAASRGPLGMAAMGRTGSGGKKVRLLVPDVETSAHVSVGAKDEERTNLTIAHRRLQQTNYSLQPHHSPQSHKMENEKGDLVDLYVPRKCSATNRIIKAKDHASVQISVGKVDENGRYTGENQVYALCGFVRAMGEGDDSLNRLAQRDGMLKGVWSGQKMR